MGFYKKDEYNDIFDNGEENGIDYSELGDYEFEDDREEELESVRGISSGECYRYSCSGTMTLQDDSYFICDCCNTIVDAELYYGWLIGMYDLENEDDEYDTIYE